MDALYSFLAALALMFLIYMFARRRRRDQLPLGPISFPIIGNAQQLGMNLHMKFGELHRTYGPAFLVKLGSRPLVVISSLEMAKKILMEKGRAFMGKPNTFFSHELTRESKDICFGSNSVTFQLQRKMASLALQRLTENDTELELHLLHEFQKLCTCFDDLAPDPVDLSEPIDWVIYSLMAQVVFGHEYQQDDPELDSLREVLKALSRSVLYSDLKYDLLWSTFFAHFLKTGKHKEFFKAVEYRDLIFDAKLATARSAFNKGEVSSFTEALLMARMDLAEEIADAGCVLTDDHLVMAMFDVYTMGVQAIADGLKWAILYMSEWPEIQDAVYSELEKVVGRPTRDNFVRLRHGEELPYTQAVIWEVLRLSCVSCMPILRETTERVRLHSYDLPKGCRVLVNLYEMHHCEKYFEEPYRFKAERFLDDHGKLCLGKSAAFLPFGAGFRGCMGETLATGSLFVMTSNLVHRFLFRTAPGEPHPDLRGAGGVTFSPKPFKVVLESRILSS